MHYKKLLSIIFLILLTTSLFITFPTTVFAEAEETVDIPEYKDPDAGNDRCPMCKQTHQLSDLGAFKAPYKWKRFLFGNNNLFNQLANNGILDYDITKSSAWSGIKDLYKNLTATIGNVLVIFYFFGELYNLFADDKLTPETFFLCLVKVTIGLLIISNVFEVMSIAIQLSTAIIDKLLDGSADIAATNACNFEYIYQAGIFGRVGELFMVLITYAITAVSFLVLQFFCIIRLLDLLVKIFFAPIAMADIGFKGTNGSGWRYFKKIIATALQGGVMFATVYIQAQMTSNGKFAGNIVVTIVSAIAMIAIFKKSEAIASDIVGA